MYAFAPESVSELMLVTSTFLLGLNTLVSPIFQCLLCEEIRRGAKILLKNCFSFLNNQEL